MSRRKTWVGILLLRVSVLNEGVTVGMNMIISSSNSAIPPQLILRHLSSDRVLHDSMADPHSVGVCEETSKPSVPQHREAARDPLDRGYAMKQAIGCAPSQVFAETHG